MQKNFPVCIKFCSKFSEAFLLQKVLSTENLRPEVEHFDKIYQTKPGCQKVDHEPAWRTNMILEQRFILQ